MVTVFAFIYSAMVFHCIDEYAYNHLSVIPNLEKLWNQKFPEVVENSFGDKTCTDISCISPT